MLRHRFDFSSLCCVTCLLKAAFVKKLDDQHSGARHRCRKVLVSSRLIAMIIFVAGQYSVVMFLRTVTQRLKVMWPRLKYLDAMSSELL